MRLGNTTLNKKKLTQIISTPVSRIQKANCDLEEKVSCEPLIQSEIESSVTPISALFSW